MSADPNRSLLTKRSIVAGPAGGLVHASAAIGLWNRWFDTVWEVLEAKPLDGTYILLGMFLLGFVPVALYVAWGVVSPAAVVAAFLLLTGIGSWLASPVRAPSAAPTPFALYILLWVGVVAVAGLTGRWERRRGRRAAG